MKMLLPSLAILALNGCSPYREPDAQDPSPILGCYTSTDAPAFTLGPKGFTVIETGKSVPFRYEFRKVGMGINVELSAEIEAGRYVFRPSYGHFYRVFFSDGVPSIPIHFSKEGYRVDYRHKPTSDCRS